MIDCSQANNCCDKAQYKDAKPAERLKLLFHLAFCKACREYTKKNHKLSKLVEKSKLQICPEERKKQWKESIEKEYAKNNV